MSNFLRMVRFSGSFPVCAERVSTRAGYVTGNMEALGLGRIMNAGPETHGFSVDVVQMDEIVGPHHRHPTGEIDMIIPETQGAEFDGHGEGWLVYGPDSAHSPTVTNGRATVLYLLPGGQIEFTGA